MFFLVRLSFETVSPLLAGSMVGEGGSMRAGVRRVTPSQRGRPRDLPLWTELLGLSGHFFTSYVSSLFKAVASCRR